MILEPRKRLHVPVGGGELAVHRLGDGRGEPALAIRIITSTNRTWLAVAEPGLGDGPTLPSAAVDLRGRGVSQRLPPPYGIDAHVQDMVAVLDHLELQRAVVVGHWLGAYVAVRLALAHPDRRALPGAVDGGLAIPGAEGQAPGRFLEAFLGPALAHSEMTFESHSGVPRLVDAPSRPGRRR